MPNSDTTIDPRRVEAACVVLHSSEGWRHISKTDGNQAWAKRERALVAEALAAVDAVGAINDAAICAQRVFDQLCEDPRVWATHGKPREDKETLIVAAIEKAINDGR